MLSITSYSATVKKCTASSKQQTTTLLELYTSEGCSSCPPADSALSKIGKRADLKGKVVPLSLHVDYWNYLGWKDPFSKAQFTKRQRSYAAIWRSGTIYTPQFILSGKNQRPGLFGYSLSGQIESRYKLKPNANITISLQNRSGNRLHLSVKGRLVKTGNYVGKAMYVAVYESGLREQIVRGENRGRLLSHDHVVRTLYGPVLLDRQGKVIFTKLINIPAGWNRRSLGVAAFVQDVKNGKVLQAIALPLCQ
jgi:hypothetical protein